jgi:hypothetical protein
MTAPEAIYNMEFTHDGNFFKASDLQVYSFYFLSGEPQVLPDGFST